MLEKLLEKDWQVFFILVWICLLLYANSINGVYISADDIQGMQLNPTRVNYDFRCLNSVINTTLNKLFGTKSVIPFHSASIILHAVNVCLVFVFLKLFFSKEISFVGSILFAVLPTNTEAISWISGRGYLVTNIFILVPFLLYHKYTERKYYAIYYIIALVMFGYYVNNHSFGFYIGFPFMLILFDTYFNKIKERFVLWLPFLLVLGLRIFYAREAILARIFSISEMPIIEQILHIEGIEYFAYPAYSIMTSFLLILFPANLSFYHEPLFLNIALIQYGFGILLLIFSFIALSPNGTQILKNIFTASVFYCLFLLPTFSPINISWLLAERYLYTPAIAFVMIVCTIYSFLKNKKMFVIVLSIFICFYAARTLIRNKDYQDSIRFWKTTVKVCPNSARSYNNLATQYALKKDYKTAMGIYWKSLFIDPNYSLVHDNIAKIYIKLGIKLNSLNENIRYLNEEFSKIDKDIPLNKTTPEQRRIYYSERAMRKFIPAMLERGVPYE